MRTFVGQKVEAGVALGHQDLVVMGLKDQNGREEESTTPGGPLSSRCW